MTPRPNTEPEVPDPLKAWAIELFEELRRQSGEGVGINRPTYGAGETRAMETIAETARGEGLTVEIDAAANVVITLPGEDDVAPAVACGSHVDSVPQGGNYDGAAGVVAGLLALVRAKRSNVRPPRPLKLFVLRGEESAWFGRAYIGSSALFGGLAASDLELRRRGARETLAEAMAACGADLIPIRAGNALLDPSSLACFFELHIEQGPVMVARKVPVGLVTGIRGNIRHPNAVCRGNAGHAGAVPRWLRNDAVFALSELVMRLDQHWMILLEQGEDLVVTLGIVGTDPAEHAMSRIPGEVDFSLEYRSQSAETMDGFAGILEEEMDIVGRNRRVAFELGPAIPTPPARTDEVLLEHLAALCQETAIPFEKLPSGAGHDAAVFANAGIPTAMVFIRNEHGSHNPDEAMAYDDFFSGAQLLYDALLTAPEVLP